MLAIKSDIGSLRRIDLETDLETICVELYSADCPKIILTVIYGPKEF